MDSAIVQAECHVAELKEQVHRPTKTFDIVDQRPQVCCFPLFKLDIEFVIILNQRHLLCSSPSQDPLGDHLKMMMQLIHDFMQLPHDFTFRMCGTQEYEADVVIFNERGKTKQTVKSKKIFFFSVWHANYFFLLTVFRSERGQQDVGSMCSPPAAVQRCLAHQRHPEDGGCLPLSG